GLHRPAGHRFEIDDAMSAAEKLAIVLCQPDEHLVLEQAGEHVAVHEGGRIAEHLPPFDARVVRQALVEQLDEPPRRLGPGHRRLYPRNAAYTAFCHTGRASRAPSRWSWPMLATASGPRSIEFWIR